MSLILAVDDEVSMLRVVSALLRADGHEVVTAQTAELGMAVLKEKQIDLLIADIRMSPTDGMQLLRYVRANHRDVSVIMLTAYGTVETAIEAMKLGAFDYVPKPFKSDELLLVVKRALEYRHAIVENEALKERAVTLYRVENIVAESASMKAVCEMIERVAPTDSTVLIQGESGTGKEVVAKAIHTYSKRNKNRFLAVNCAALPESLLESEMFGHVKGAFTGATSGKVGLFEAADGGTILLDEVTSMPLSTQSKLLRALQEKEVRRVGGTQTTSFDARVIAATNQSLDELMKAGKFREDLFYRLSVIPIIIEPLRNRREDIMPLVYHALRCETPRGKPLPSIRQDTKEILVRYAWPGNVRELISAVKHALAFRTDDEIAPDVLPVRIVNAVSDVLGEEDSGPDVEFGFRSLKAFLRDNEAEYMNQVIAAFNGDKDRAAEAMKISVATLYRKLHSTDTSEAD